MIVAHKIKLWAMSVKLITQILAASSSKLKSLVTINHDAGIGEVTLHIIQWHVFLYCVCQFVFHILYLSKPALNKSRWSFEFCLGLGCRVFFFFVLFVFVLLCFDPEELSSL